MGSNTTPPAEPGSYPENGGTSLLFNWLKRVLGFSKELSVLVLAESRLAVASSAQLLFLCVLGAFITGFVWLLACAIIGITLSALGLSLFVTVLILLLLHAIFLICIAFAIRSTLEGFNFTATKQLLLYASDKKKSDHHD